MSKRVVKILAIVALVFMALFTASMIAWCFDRTLFNNSIGYVCIFTGGIGIGVYVVLMLVKRAEARAARPQDPVDVNPEGQPSEQIEDDKTGIAPQTPDNGASDRIDTGRT